MTQVERARLNARFRGAVYGIDVLDHVTRQVMPCDYVGKTRQRGRARESQHRDRQPFSDLIVGDSHVLWEGMCTEEELDEWERYFIQDVEVRPRLNEVLNEDNPHMISKQVQRAQRWQRDDVEGRPRWVPFDRRQRASLLEWDQVPASRDLSGVSVRRLPGGRSWRPWQIKAGLWSMSWLLLVIATFGACNRLGLAVTWKVPVCTATAVTVVLVLWSLAGAPLTRRQWRKWRRDLRPGWLR